MPKEGQELTTAKDKAPTSADRSGSGGGPAAGRVTEQESGDGLFGSGSYKKPSLFSSASTADLFGDTASAEATGRVEGTRDANVARLTLQNPTWDPNAIVGNVGGKDEKGGWVEATAARNAPGTRSEISPGVKADRRMVAGTAVDPGVDASKLQSGDLHEEDLEALTPAQVAQVNPLGTAPRNILKKAMHESWHHAKESLLVRGTNKDARSMLMAKLWEFRQWHHNMILQRTQKDPAIGKDGLTEWKTAGSTTLTSDIDVNLKGAKTELAVAKFNQLFKDDGFKHEAGVVYDVNVYAVDFMHKDTFKGLAETGGRIERHDFGAEGPHPETRVSAKEGAREGSQGGGVGTSNAMLEGRMVQADADLQRVWSLVKMRLYMTGAQWDTYVRDTNLPPATLTAVLGRYNAYMNELSAKMSDGAEVVHAADAARDTGFQMLDKLAQAKGTATGADGENIKMAASNRIYEEKLGQMATLRQKVQTQIDRRRALLESGNKADAEGLDAAIDGNLAILRDLISECAMFSNEAYVTDGAVNHVVVGLQSKIPIKQTKSESLDAFNENVGDSLKEIARHSRTLGEAAYKAGKYLWRMADAAQNLGVRDTETDRGLQDKIRRLYNAGNEIANKIKGGDDSQDLVESKAAAAVTSFLDIRNPDDLMALVRSLAARVSVATNETVRTDGQGRAATVQLQKS